MTPEQELELFDKTMEIVRGKRYIEHKRAIEAHDAEVARINIETKDKLKQVRKACDKRINKAQLKHNKEESAAYDELSSEAMILWRHRLDEQKSSG